MTAVSNDKPVTGRLPLVQTATQAAPLTAYARRADAAQLAKMVTTRLTDTPPSPGAGGPRALVIDLRPDDDADSSTLRQILHDTVAAIQTHVLTAEAEATTAAVILIIDADGAMGDSERCCEGQYWEAAIAGAALSMTRTLAIELAKTGHCVNTLLVDQIVDAETTALASAADQASIMLTQLTPVITGQQVFASGGRDTGRLRP